MRLPAVFRLRAALLAAAFALTAAGSAAAATESAAREALIRPNLGIGRVTLGMTLAEVKRRLGPPFQLNKRVRRGAKSEYIEYSWDFATFRVGFVKTPSRTFVVLVATTLRRERTRSGIGVGSTPENVARRLGAECVDPRETYWDKSDWYREPALASWHYCMYGSPRGRRTVFLITCAERNVQRCPGYIVGEVVVRGAF